MASAVETMLCNMLGIKPSEFAEAAGNIQKAAEWFRTANLVMIKQNTAILANQKAIMTKLEIGEQYATGPGDAGNAASGGDGGDASRNGTTG